MEIDHVVIAVADLAEAGRAIETRHGLVSIEGGRHEGWGTANRIIPLRGTYLELIAAVDEEQAAATDLGRWVLGRRSSRGRPLGWVVRTNDIDAIAGRLGLTVGEGSRLDRNGRPVRWRMAGTERAMAEPSHPFFIEWSPEAEHPGNAPAAHPAGPVRIAGLELSGDEERLAAWLGDDRLPVTVRPGAPAVDRIVMAGDAGEFALDLAER